MENLRLEVERDVFVTSRHYHRQPSFYFWFEYTDPYYGYNPDRDELDDDRAFDLAFHFPIRPVRCLPTMEISR